MVNYILIFILIVNLSISLGIGLYILQVKIEKKFPLSYSVLCLLYLSITVLTAYLMAFTLIAIGGIIIIFLIYGILVALLHKREFHTSAGFIATGLLLLFLTVNVRYSMKKPTIFGKAPKNSMVYLLEPSDKEKREYTWNFIANRISPPPFITRTLADKTGNFTFKNIPKLTQYTLLSVEEKGGIRKSAKRVNNKSIYYTRETTLYNISSFFYTPVFAMEPDRDEQISKEDVSFARLKNILINKRREYKVDLTQGKSIKCKYIKGIPSLYFESASSKINNNKRNRNAIKKTTQSLIKFKHKIFLVVIESYCDQSGDSEFNYRLGNKRARAALSGMIKSFEKANKIDVFHNLSNDDKIKIWNYGEEKSIKWDSEEERRVDFKVLLKID